MSEYCCRIEKMSNGYEVEIKDPEIVKKNAKRDTKTGYTPYKDPTKSFVFKTVKEVLDFLEKNLDKALPDDEYETSFDLAMADDDEDD